MKNENQPKVTNIEQKNKEKDSSVQHKKPSRLALVIVVCIIIGIIGVSLIQKSPTPKKTFVPTPTPLPAYVQTKLTLDALIPAPGKPITGIDINLDSGNNQVTAVQFAIRFDPELVQNVYLSPGTFLKQPVQLINTVDYKTGLAEYALGIAPTQTAVRGKGVAAIIHFLPAAGENGFTTIEILPTSLVTSRGIAQSVLRNSYYLTFSLAPMSYQSGH